MIKDSTIEMFFKGKNMLIINSGKKNKIIKNPKTRYIIFLFLNSINNLNNNNIILVLCMKIGKKYNIFTHLFLFFFTKSNYKPNANIIYAKAYLIEDAIKTKRNRVMQSKTAIAIDHLEHLFILP